jgi:hypothetical protein
MGMTSSVVAELDRDDRDYDDWVAVLTQASARLDVLEMAVTELCRLCQREDVHREKVLELLERQAR